MWPHHVIRIYLVLHHRASADLQRPNMTEITGMSVSLCQSEIELAANYPIMYNLWCLFRLASKNVQRSSNSVILHGWAPQRIRDTFCFPFFKENQFDPIFPLLYLMVPSDFIMTASGK